MSALLTVCISRSKKLRTLAVCFALDRISEIRETPDPNRSPGWIRPPPVGVGWAVWGSPHFCPAPHHPPRGLYSFESCSIAFESDHMLLNHSKGLLLKSQRNRKKYPLVGRDMGPRSTPLMTAIPFSQPRGLRRGDGGAQSMRGTESKGRSWREREREIFSFSAFWPYNVPLSYKIYPITSVRLIFFHRNLSRLCCIHQAGKTSAQNNPPSPTTSPSSNVSPGPGPQSPASEGGGGLQGAGAVPAGDCCGPGWRGR